MKSRARSITVLVAISAALVATFACTGADHPVSLPGPDGEAQSSAAPPDAAATVPEAMPPQAATVPCDPTTTGLVRPLPTCSPERPCIRLAPELPQTPLTSPSDPITCSDQRWTERREWMIDGVSRQACFFRPIATGSKPSRPLVVWFHPGGVGGDVAEQETHVLDKAVANGFMLAVVQGRNVHFPTKEPRDGRHHDFYFRDLRSPSTNPDIASADRLIDDIVDEGGVDPKRIYVMGWSNGAFFGQLYAIARHETSTPKGARVAAAAVFAAGDPFEDIERDPFTDLPWTGSPSCRLSTTPKSAVPILLVYRTCDRAVPCGAGDSACFAPEPGFVTSTWLATAPARGVTGLVGRLLGGVERGQDIDTDQAKCSPLPNCAPSSCATNPASDDCKCLLNHLRWPDGDYNAGRGTDREPMMLEFLRTHPLP